MDTATHENGRMMPVSMLLPQAMLASLDRAAAADGRSRSSMARRLLEDALSAQGARTASAESARGQ